MIILFVDVIVIRYKYQDAFTRVKLAPTWVFYLCALFDLVASAVGVHVTFTGPWTSLVTSTQWLLWIGGIGLLSLIAGVLLYFVGQFTAGRQETDDQEIIAEVADSAE